MELRNVCVYCGSSAGRDPAYVEAAGALGRALVARGLGLVYGGASVGVMGAVADAVLDLGGRAVGVIPEALVRKEIAHGGLTELVVTSSMHERKTRMADLSDAFVALPGGIGTLEEIFEAWTWGQLGLHAKPFGFLNVAGYWDGLVSFLDHAVRERFVREPHRAMLVVSEDPEELLDRFAAWRAPDVPKWIRKGDE
ncbi:MAG: TIGR00730 family Rossman fold protein [Thermoanaerobaculia bacterium]|nr:TIGR00730 family Rossman fold protein [Thermoanaerobaculia bacterium]